MKAKCLNIKGFRSLRMVNWEPGSLNVVIGANVSGKSNLLRALLLLQRAAEGDLPKVILHQGGIAPLLWDGKVKHLSWKVETANQGSLTYELQLQRIGNTSSYRVQDEALYGRQGRSNSFLERQPGTAPTGRFQDKNAVIMDRILPDDQTLLSSVGYGPIGAPASEVFSQYLRSWNIYHDLRVDQEAPVRQATVARVEKRLDPDGQNLVPLLYTLYSEDLAFRNALDTGMKAAFGNDFEELTFPPAADQRVQLRLRWKSLKSAQSAADLSDGTLRFLMLLSILANPDPGSLIAIDEPEVGLHPSMLPVIAEYAAEAAERTQVIFTTHSPQFLDSFRDVVPTTTVAQWVDGETKLSVLDGEELARWLKEYSLGALFRSGELEGMA